jgi:glycine cleavage system H protein
MSHPADLKYTKSHEFLKVLPGNKARIGITFHAQQELGDITYVELPDVGTELTPGETLGTVESVKAVSDVYVPVSGKVTEINAALEETPELINEDPYEKGWLIVIEMSDPSQLNGLLSKDDYEKLL